MDTSRYLGLFVTDAREHLAHLEADLVRFEEAPQEDERRILLDGIFRHLHSMKGSSAMMGLDPIAKVAEVAEQLASDARSGTRRLASREIDLLLEACDALRGLLTRLSEGLPLAPLESLLERLTTATAPQHLESVAGPSGPARFSAEVPHTVVRIVVSSKTATPAARAFIASRRLESLGRALAMSPPLEIVRSGQLPGLALTIALTGQHDLATIKQALLRVPELESVELLPAWRAEALPAPEPVAATAARMAAADQTVRVRVDLLDQLLELAGELVLSSARLRDVSRHVPAAVRPQLDEEVDRLGRLVKDLNGRVLVTRQTPAQHLADRLPRVVRDLSRRLAKPLKLQVEGADVTLDRGLLDALADPLIHALRNAADHGIEPMEDRAAAGKAPTGLITFAARRERDRVIVEIRDDGAGFDVAALKERAVQAGAFTPVEAEKLTDSAALRLAFLPGLTTRATSSDVSGRGVGMDAVQVAVEQLGGSVLLESVHGVGSCVRFVLPATVSVVNLLLIDLGGETFGMPMSKVLFAAEGDLALADTHGALRLLTVGADRFPAYSLGHVIGLPEKTRGVRPLVVVEGEGQKSVVAVDRLLGQEEVVVRPVGPPLERIRGLSGTAILGSGRPIFVLDVPRLLA